MLLRSLLCICLVLYCSQRAGILISCLWSNSTDESTDVVAFDDHSLPSNEMKIREKLNMAVEEKRFECLTTPSVEADQNHEELSADLKMIKEQAKFIRENIEWNIESIVAQIDTAAFRYNQSFEKLRKINESIYSVWDGIESVLSKMGEKMEWINELFGDKSEQLNRMYGIFHHIVYLLGMMIIAAFLQAPLTTRVSIIGIIPLNFMKFFKHGTDVYLDFTTMTILICLITGLNIFMRYLQDEETQVNKKTRTKSRLQSILEPLAIVKKGYMPTFFSVIPWFWTTLKEAPENLPLYSENNQWPSTHLEKNKKNEVAIEKIPLEPISTDETTATGQPLKEVPGNLPSYSERKNLSTLDNITNNEVSDQTNTLATPLGHSISCSEQPLKEVSENLPLDSEKKNLTTSENFTKNETSNRKKEPERNFVDGISTRSGQPLKEVLENLPSDSEKKNLTTLQKIPDNEILNQTRQLEEGSVGGTLILKQPSTEALQSYSSTTLEEITKKETLDQTKAPQPISIALSVKVDNRTDDRNSVRSTQYAFNPTASLCNETSLNSFAHNINATQPVPRSFISFSEMFQDQAQRSASYRCSPQSGICGAMTQKGTPCRNKPSYGGPTCWRH